MKDPFILEVKGCAFCPFKIKKIHTEFAGAVGLSYFCSFPTFAKHVITSSAKIPNWCPLKEQRIIVRVKDADEN